MNKEFLGAAIALLLGASSAWAGSASTTITTNYPTGRTTSGDGALMVPANPSLTASIADPSGNTWSVNPSADAALQDTVQENYQFGAAPGGDYPLYVNGSRVTASDGQNLFSRVQQTNGAIYAWNTVHDVWYVASGTSLSPYGAAGSNNRLPPLETATATQRSIAMGTYGGTGIPGAPWPNANINYTTSWQGSGVGYFGGGCIFSGQSPCAVQGLTFDLYASDVDPTLYNNGQGTPPGFLSTEDEFFNHFAAGDYDYKNSDGSLQIIGDLINPYANSGADLIEIRLAHEWGGNWYEDSPWAYHQEGVVSWISVQNWVDAYAHLIGLIHQDIPPAQYPQLKLEMDGGGYTDYPSANVTGTFDFLETLPSSNCANPCDRAHVLAQQVDELGGDDYLGSYGGNTTSEDTNFVTSVGQGSPYQAVALAQAEKYGKPLSWPEWADLTDGSGAPVDGNVVRDFIAFAYSSQGPGPTGVTAMSYWGDTSGGCPADCAMNDATGAPKAAAFEAAAPGGIGGTHYVAGFSAWPPIFSAWSGASLDDGRWDWLIPEAHAAGASRAISTQKRFAVDVTGKTKAQLQNLLTQRQAILANAPKMQAACRAPQSLCTMRWQEIAKQEPLNISAIQAALPTAK